MGKKNEEFFEEMTGQSEVKTEIVRKYFWAWAKIISKQVIKRGKSRIAYADLFAGPGVYEDGTPSTPVLILQSAIRDPEISQMLIALFNDEESEYVTELERTINNLPGITLLKNKPIIRNYRVDDELTEKIEAWHYPTLFFLDPWGYKGLSRRLFRATLRPWGSDCIFFFNYNRINAALNNSVFKKNMDEFFGAERADTLRLELRGRSPSQRQALIIKALKEVVEELGASYTIEYYFKDDSGAKTSHFLILATKNVLGYDIMKSIMANESSSDVQGVSSFGFNPHDKERVPSLFDHLDGPIDDLAETLAGVFAGRTLTAEEVYQQHHIGQQLVFKNYQDALKKLETEGRITANPPASERTRGGMLTFGRTVVVTFLPKKG